MQRTPNNKQVLSSKRNQEQQNAEEQNRLMSFVAHQEVIKQ
jgi:hypothetical protein